MSVHVISAFSRKEDADRIRSVITRSGIARAEVCTSGAGILQASDRIDEAIIVCGWQLRDMTCIQLFEQMPESFRMILIASSAVLDADLPEAIIRLPVPLRSRPLLDAIDEVSRQMIRLRRKRRPPAVRSAQQTEEIRRAKELLMERHHITEEEAHHYLQKTSMDSGTNMAETAQMILRLME